MMNRTRPAHRIAAAGAAVLAGALILAACASQQQNDSAGAPAGSTSAGTASPGSASPGLSDGSTTDPGSAPAPGDPTGTPAPEGVAGYLFTARAATGRMLVDGKPPTMAFHGPAQVALNAGCNGMGGTPVFNGTGFKVNHIMSTMMACIDPSGGTSVMDQENWFKTWLEAGVSWELSGTDLVLSADGVTITFSRTGPAESAAIAASTDGSPPSVPAEHTVITAPTTGVLTPLSTVPPARPSPSGIPIPTPPSK
jgi:heat shock protein HslJ